MTTDLDSLTRMRLRVLALASIPATGLLESVLEDLSEAELDELTLASETLLRAISTTRRQRNLVFGGEPSCLEERD